MTASLSPRQLLEHHRARKKLYREALRARGYSQQTLWTTTAGHEALRAWAAEDGPELVLQEKTPSVRETIAVRRAEAALGEKKACPAYTSDIPKHEAPS